MLIGEPPRTAYDLHFRVLGFPVRVHPLFWLIAAVLGFQMNDPVLLLLWIVVLFVSILVHEMGHALLMRRFGEGARVVLYSFGGLAIADSGGLWRPSSDRDRGRSSREQIIISAAGPAAGFVLAGLVIVFVYASGGRMFLERDFPVFWNFELGGQLASNRYVLYLTHFFLWINIFWGLMNLLPVLPLDGGRICQELLTTRDPWEGQIKALWVSTITAGVVAGISLISATRNEGSFFVAVLFGLLAFSNYMTIQQTRGGGFGGGRPW